MGQCPWFLPSLWEGNVRGFFPSLWEGLGEGAKLGAQALSPTLSLYRPET